LTAESIAGAPSSAATAVDDETDPDVGGRAGAAGDALVAAPLWPTLPPCARPSSAAHGSAQHRMHSNAVCAEGKSDTHDTANAAPRQLDSPHPAAPTGSFSTARLVCHPLYFSPMHAMSSVVRRDDACFVMLCRRAEWKRLTRRQGSGCSGSGTATVQCRCCCCCVTVRLEWMRAISSVHSPLRVSARCLLLSVWRWLRSLEEEWSDRLLSLFLLFFSLCFSPFTVAAIDTHNDDPTITRQDRVRQGGREGGNDTGTPPPKRDESRQRASATTTLWLPAR